MVCMKIKLTWGEIQGWRSKDGGSPRISSKDGDPRMEIQGWYLVTNVDISTEHEFSYSDHSVWSQGHWEEWLSPPDPHPFLPPLYTMCLLRAGTGSLLFTVVFPVPEAMPGTEWRCKEHIPPPHGPMAALCLPALWLCLLLQWKCPHKRPHLGFTHHLQDSQALSWE